MVLRAPRLCQRPQASSRSRKTWSTGSERALSMNFWLEPGNRQAGPAGRSVLTVLSVLIDGSPCPLDRLVLDASTSDRKRARLR